MEIVYANYENFVTETSKGLVLVDFFATWCGPCKMLEPVIEQLMAELPSLKVVKVDIDEYQELAQKYDVMSIPTLILFKDGELVDQKLGFQEKAVLKDWIEAK